MNLKAIGVTSKKDFLYMLFVYGGGILLTVLLATSTFWFNLPEKGFIDLSPLTYVMGVMMMGVFLVWVTYSVLGVFLTPKAVNNESFNGKFSILIPAKDEEKTIDALINDLLNQTYKNFEVIVICHNCQDNTCGVVSQFKDERVKALELIGKPGKSIALNHGIRYASGDVVVVFDADNRVPPDFLEKLSKYFPYYDAVQTRVETLNPNYSFLTKMADLEFTIFTRAFQSVRAALGLNVALSGTGQAVKTNVLKEVGYWDEWALTEDLALFTKLSLKGYKVGWCHETYILDEKTPYWSSFVRQRARWLRGHLQVFTYYAKQCWKKPGVLHLLITPAFLLLGYFLMISLWFMYLFRLPVSASFLSPYTWLAPWVIWIITAIIYVLKTRGVRELVLLPAFLVYLYHWVLVATLIWQIKAWTKTPHGFTSKELPLRTNSKVLKRCFSGRGCRIR